MGLQKSQDIFILLVCKKTFAFEFQKLLKGTMQVTAQAKF